MRERNKVVTLRLNEREFYLLNLKVKRYSSSKSAFLRSLIQFINPPPMPSKELLEYIRQLRYIGNNLNQLTIKAHQTGDIHYDEIRSIRDELYRSIRDIKQMISMEHPIDPSRVLWQ